MIVTSALELYTQLFAWHMYTATAYLFFGTGLAVIPFILMSIDTLLESWENDWDSVGLLKTLEARAYTMLLVIFFCFSPTINISFSGAQYAYSSCAADDAERETEIKEAETGTTYDKQADKIAAIYRDRQPKAPLWWYLSTKLWQGTAGALIQEIPCTSDVLSISQTLVKTKLQDPDLLTETNQFYGDCYLKASNQFLSNIPPDSELPAALRGGDIYDDVGWLGSSYFIDNPKYYVVMRPSKEVKAFPYSELRDKSVASPPPAGITAGGYPSCYEWWTGMLPDGVSINRDRGLEARLMTHLRSVSPADFEAKFLDAFNYTDEDVADQHRLRIALTTADDAFNPLSLPNFANTYSSSDTSGWGSVFNAFHNVKDSTIVIAGAARNIVPAVVDTTTARHAATIVEALVKMMFTLLLPILMWISLYDIRMIITLTAVQFSFYMWSYIFGICYWMNTFLYRSMFTTNDVLTSLKRMATEANLPGFTALIWIIMFSYIALPVVFTSMMGIVGKQIGNGIASAMGGMIGNLGKGAPGGMPKMPKGKK